MSKVNTVNGGYAEVIQKSKCAVTGKEILTVSVKYGLIIHAEFLRHRMLSRGVKSNRAIPCKQIRHEVITDPYVPVWFGRNQSGMVAKAEVKYPSLARALWRGARYPAVALHYLGEKALGGHKEWLNRLLNPWQWVRETITATEWDNLYTLRIHPAAQQDIQVIVKAIYEADQDAVALLLDSGEWHVPYVTRERHSGRLRYLDNNGEELVAGQAVKASAARCARSSYDNHDKSMATFQGDIGLYNMLIEDDPKHASPIEHQATPMEEAATFSVHSLSRGETHVDDKGAKWSGNFKGFVQYRQLIKGHVCNNYVGGGNV